jgi:hypothetical protein
MATCDFCSKPRPWHKTKCWPSRELPQAGVPFLGAVTRLEAVQRAKYGLCKIGRGCCATGPACGCLWCVACHRELKLTPGSSQSPAQIGPRPKPAPGSNQPPAQIGPGLKPAPSPSRRIWSPAGSSTKRGSLRTMRWH